MTIQTRKGPCINKPEEKIQACYAGAPINYMVSNRLVCDNGHKIKIDLKGALKKRFAKLYPKKRLLAVHLDGFSHAVFYDNGTKNGGAVICERFSLCMPEGRWSAAASAFFSGIGHSQYQNNAREIIYILPNAR